MVCPGGPLSSRLLAHESLGQDPLLRERHRRPLSRRNIRLRRKSDHGLRPTLKRLDLTRSIVAIASRGQGLCAPPPSSPFVPTGANLVFCRTPAESNARSAYAVRFNLQLSVVCPDINHPLPQQGARIGVSLVDVLVC